MECCRPFYFLFTYTIDDALLKLMIGTGLNCLFEIVGRIQYASESLFWYDMSTNESFDGNQHPEFVPIFDVLDACGAANLTEDATAVCTVNGTTDQDCIYDYCLTGDRSFAMNTQNQGIANSITTSTFGCEFKFFKHNFLCQAICIQRTPKGPKFMFSCWQWEFELFCRSHINCPFM